MRRVIAASALFLIAAVAATSQPSYADLFAEFKHKYGKTYSSKAEESKRFDIFVENMKRAAEMQKLNPKAKFGVNGYSDVSAAEFKVKHSGEAHFRSASRKRASLIGERFGGRKTSVKKIDWREKGAVTPIKNQLSCGGCWAFSTTGNIEGQWAIAGKGLVSLSEQQLLSCDTTCNGCHGGIMDDAFEYLVNVQNGAITSEAQYPFVSGEGIVPECDMNGRTAAAYIANHQDIAHDEGAMATFVAEKGPLSIAVDSTSFQSYTSGIMTNCVSNQVDHAVLIVGFNFEGTTPYWIVKNQWGTVWGEDGYIYLEYGTNQCLLTTLPSSSVVSNPPALPPAGSPAPPSAPLTSNGTFTQFQCSSSMCLSGCTNQTLPNGKCLSLTAGGSAITSCGQTYLHIMQFNSSDCTGAWSQGLVPLNQCSSAGNGQYLYDECTTGSGSGSNSLAEPSLKEARQMIMRSVKFEVPRDF